MRDQDDAAIAACLKSYKGQLSATRIGKRGDEVNDIVGDDPCWI
jgi:hypothetical protein